VIWTVLQLTNTKLLTMVSETKSTVHQGKFGFCFE